MSTFESPPTTFLLGLLAATLYAGGTAAEPADMPFAATESTRAGAGLRAGDWLARARIVGSIPTETRSRISLIGGRIDTPAAILPDVDVSYFLTDHVSVEAQAGAVRTRPVIRDSLVGDIAIGSIWTGAAAGILQYHVLPNARLNPYLGVGVVATTPLVIQREKGIPSFKLKSQASLLLQAGVDYHLTGNWFANAMLKYVFVPRQSYALAGVAVEADLNQLILGGGIGYRF